MTKPKSSSLTVREALIEAQRAVVEATQELRSVQERRLEVFRAAHGQGLSVRQIGTVVGISGQAVHQLIGSGERSDQLDRPFQGK